jgi:hypothetical protein
MPTLVFSKSINTKVKNKSLAMNMQAKEYLEIRKRNNIVFKDCSRDCSARY